MCARPSNSLSKYIRLLPDSLLPPVLGLPPRDGRALFRLVGVLGAILFVIMIVVKLVQLPMFGKYRHGWRRRVSGTQSRDKFGARRNLLKATESGEISR